MATAWHLECRECRWTDFAETREAAERMAENMRTAPREKPHTVTIELWLRDPTR
jgi:hypothetical protein